MSGHYISTNRAVNFKKCLDGPSLSCRLNQLVLTSSLGVWAWATFFCTTWKDIEGFISKVWEAASRRRFRLSIPEKVLQTLGNLAMESFHDDDTHLQSMGSCQLEEVPSVHSIEYGKSLLESFPSVHSREILVFHVFSPTKNWGICSYLGILKTKKRFGMTRIWTLDLGHD